MEYTLDERIMRIWDYENVRKTMHRLAYFISNEDRRRALRELWVATPDNMETASLGYNTGYYVGMDEITRHFILDRSEELYDNLKARSEESSDVDFSNRNLGYGCATIMTLNTPVIKISGDGRYARFLGYSPGFTSVGATEGKANSYFTLDSVYADLVKEGDEWRIWHLVFVHDHTMEIGEDYGSLPVLGWEDPLNKTFGDPTVKQTVYDPLFGWEHVYEDMPRAFYTYCDKGGYGPNGDLGKPYYDRRTH